ncbi:sigma 54-interacting transcriptional regulator [Alicyclobacillus sp. SO9]|uniref:sigma 54-interacting transcriptional regulator n=1 Tax=Alicyclobacillus sp. SO9 TaxID=2665646 RepID=UPI0018E70B27|nr:sigma 54-interacting transcriptional regulator [Alicyclobacillus sp. SO9]QQE80300.1 sigma 54-interacting transcriptional regulator [Alicyclobacillus sp. SO9]
MSIRWCLETDDRIGMVRDIVSAVADCGGDVEAMEVVSRYVYIRLHCSNTQTMQLQSALQSVSGVRRVDAIDSLPYEADEQNLIRRVMDREGSDETLSFSGLIYKSDSMKAQVHIAKAIAARDVPVLITGESGTGKELMARAIHNASARSQHRFVAVNCAAIPETLLDSELFGYVEGAFTGARRGGRLGLFEVADGGTLFLDEIGEMNPAVQAKLLRVLSESELRRVGDSESRKVNVRVLAATNRNLEHLISTGQFRQDLFFRLNVIPIQLPPLRDRKDDIVPLAMAFISRMERRLERKFQLSVESQNAIREYAYPGNIRELQNIIERACYLCESEVLSPNLFMTDSFLPKSVPANLQDAAEDGANTPPAEAAYSSSSSVPETSLRNLVRTYELKIIQDTVNRLGSVRKAAAELGVSHTTLLNKLHRE